MPKATKDTQSANNTDPKNSEKVDSNKILDYVVASHESGEKRPQQQLMIEKVNDALVNQEHLLIQAGTGVGKSLGYLIPVAATSKRVAISTATNQLSDQIIEKDLPFLSKVLEANGRPQLSFTVLKGRANYLCREKIVSKKMQARLDTEHENGDNALIAEEEVIDEKSRFFEERRTSKENVMLLDWIDNNNVLDGLEEFGGDRKELPTVSDHTWVGFSSTNEECPGKSNCPSGPVCFAENAREKAQQADIVVTNHALIGTDLDAESKLLGIRETFIFDEVHELDRYLSDAWGTSLSIKNLNTQTTLLLSGIPTSHETTRKSIEKIRKTADKIMALIAYNTAETETQIDISDEYHVELQKLLNIYNKTQTVYTQKNNQNPSKTEKTKNDTILKTITKTIESLTQLTKKDDPEIVLWIEKTEENVTFKAAPLRIGPRLMETLDNSGATMIGTSATITVGGSFEIPVRNFALDDEVNARKYEALDAGTPFDYPKQGMLYIPAPDDFPAPVGADRVEHTEAVRDFLVEAVKSAGGHTLFLSTTKWGAIRAAERLRSESGITTPILSQYDGPAARITQEFNDIEDSTLCATMGFWHGLNIPGKSLSLVVIDKIPFAPFKHPLLQARQADVESRGHSGFMDVYVADAQVMLSQGVGRLIRHTQDRGGVAILDTRLRSKPYGRSMLRSLPPLWMTNDPSMFLGAMGRLTGES